MTNKGFILLELIVGITIFIIFLTASAYFLKANSQKIIKINKTIKDLEFAKNIAENNLNDVISPTQNIYFWEDNIRKIEIKINKNNKIELLKYE